MRVLTVLSLCDYSGTWSQPFVDAGYNVIRYDLKLGHDIRLLPLPDVKVWGILAAPSCTIFAGSGAKYRCLRGVAEVEEGKSLVAACCRFVVGCKPMWWALENPGGWLADDIGPWLYSFDPCDYAGYLADSACEAYTKRTYIWGAGIHKPAVKPVDPVLGSKMHLRYGGRTAKTKTMRSITPNGFSQAFFGAVHTNELF